MKTISTILICLLGFFYYTSGQEFDALEQDPFQLFPDTTGGLEIYFFDLTDIDNDGDSDILYPFFNDDGLGMAFQENVGSAKNPNFSALQVLQIDIDYPPGIFLPEFGDLNQDGKVDILAFGQIDSLTGFTSNFYLNTSDGMDLSFERIRGEEIGLSGIGYGLGLFKISDLNLDGDKDVLLGGSLYDGNGEGDAIFYYGQNFSASYPDFVSWYENPYEFSFTDTMDSSIFYPGDFDLDSDIDLMVFIEEPGGDDSKFYYYENIAMLGERPDFSATPSINPFDLPEDISGIPSFEDMDGDGDLDLLVLDTEDGVVFHYYRNSACVPSKTILNISSCDESYSLNDITYDVSGTYSQVLDNNAGCDSTIILNLTLSKKTSKNISEQICPETAITINDVSYDSAGTFTQNLINDNGCDSLLIITITKPEISLTVMMTDDGLQASDDFESYQWLTCPDEVLIDGAIESTFVPEENGSYSVRAMKEGCVETSSCIEFIISNLEEHLEPTFRFYPNPASHQLNIEDSESININLYDINGAIIQQILSTDKSLSVPISHLPGGVYYLRDNNSGEVKEFLKM